MRGPGPAVVVALLLGAVFPSAASAQVSGQGSNLNAPANYPYHCEKRWMPGYNGEPGAFGPGGYQDYVPQHIGTSTCSLWQIGVRGQAKTTHLVPATGTVTRARIKSGPNPAPVSIATVRQYTGRDTDGNLVTTCCYGISQTTVVNPTPNDVTEIPVNFRVEAQLYDPNVPNRAGFWDVVAVNVHGDTGTLPMSDFGGSKPLVAPDSDPGARWYFPKFNPSEHNQNPWTASGFEVLMNFDWCPATQAALRAGFRQGGGCATQGTPTPPGGGTPTPGPGTPTPGPGTGTETPGPGTGTPPAKPDAKALVGIQSSKLSLAGSSVAVAVRCIQASACAVTVRLRTAAKKPRLLGSKRATVKPGARATVKVPLSPANRKRVGAKGLKVRAEVDLGSAGTVTRNFTLRRAKR